MTTREQLEFAGRLVEEVLLLSEFEPSTLEERLQLLEDRDQIRDLIGRYALCCDAHAWDELFNRCTDDVERVRVARNERIRGKDEVRRAMSGAGLPPGEDGSKETKHMITIENVRIVEGRGDAYASAVYQLALAHENGGQYHRDLQEGRYLFAFRRENDVWKFSRFEAAHANPTVSR